MMRRLSILLLFLILIVLPMHLWGQSGCDDSPEAPTLILALVGGSCVVAARWRSARGR
jgi:XrtJ-associated TM-motif-TM protein